jgi:hypothetical protein
MKGLRTLLMNAVVVVATALLTWIVGVNWTEYVSPSVALIIVAVANMMLRLITTTPVGKIR